MADVSLSTLRGEPRRKIVTLTASDSAVAIPSWAQGGKGIVYVTGCGGGASGSVGTTSGQRGYGGGASGFAVRHPMYIPAAVSTLSATIGAGALGVTAATTANATAGGNTTVQVGSTILTLASGLARGGKAFVGNSVALDNNGNTSVLGTVSTSSNVLSGMFSPASTLSAGADGGAGTNAGGGFGGGGYSIFGAGGAGLAVGPTVNTNGDDATGYGAGGAGALWISGSAVTSGAGSPGFLTLEFVEGF